MNLLSWAGTFLTFAGTFLAGRVALGSRRVGWLLGALSCGLWCLIDWHFGLMGGMAGNIVALGLYGRNAVIAKESRARQAT